VVRLCGIAEEIVQGGAANGFVLVLAVAGALEVYCCSRKLHLDLQKVWRLTPKERNSMSVATG